MLTARPAGISFEGANPRHEHEWKVWKDSTLPAGKVLIPGVIDSTTNFIEHPELVAERIVRYAEVVGRENVIAGTDCGFGTFADNDGSIRASPGRSSRRSPRGAAGQRRALAAPSVMRGPARTTETGP